MRSGIYQITNQTNGKRYIGSAVNIRKRWTNHLFALRHQQHPNRHLQAAFDKYGETAFVFSTLEHIENALQLIPREQYFLDMLKPEYNISPTARSALGVRRSPETRKKMSKAWSLEKRQAKSGKLRGTPLSEEHRQKISKAMSGARHPNFGQHPSAKTRMKMSKAHRGERNHNFGRHPSEETKRKIRAAWTPERRQAQSEAQRGEGNYNYGKHPSEETRLKMSRSQKARQQRIRIAKNAEKGL